MRKILAATLLALTLSGCAGSLPPILENILNIPAGVLTTTIQNPVTPVNLYQAKQVYATTVDLANDYRNYCYSKPYKDLMADPVSQFICKYRRKVVRAIWIADDKAAAAIATADIFIKNNPTLDAPSAIRAAILAVTNFQNVAVATAQSVATQK